jgi:asparagine synthase (glutamine-hydrolysing)
MCGVCGVVSQQRRVDSATVLDMVDTLHHRGPDDRGVWVGGDDRASVGLGHTRLSIIDLSSAGHQPMTNEDGTIWLTYNGEVYNHRDVREPLEASGHTYRSQTDSETIIHAYEEWGDACVDRFRGMFAFAIWDGPRRRLLLARDRLGVKPLYYAVVGSTLVFASEIKAILRSGYLEPRAAEGAVPEYLALGYLAGEGTMFAGIRKLPPGHVLVWDDGRLEVRRYWRLVFQPAAASPADLQGQFRHLFEESVRMRLMSDVPLGVFLSGGLDSSAIAAVMGRYVDEPIKTFSIGYDTQYYSELSYAKQVADLVGADHHEYRLTAEEFYEAVPRLTWHEDEPLWGTASVALYFVSKLAAQHVKVVLTGEGSDELFAGYDRYWMTRLNTLALPAFLALPPTIRRLLRRGLLDGPLPERVRRGLSHTCVGRDQMPDTLFFDNWFGVFPSELQKSIAGPALRRQLAHVDVYRAHRQLYEESGADAVVDRLLYSDINSNLVELLMKQDQMSMATSIESRVPFLDYRLAEFAATVPWRQKIHRRSGKHIVKAALAEYLPASIRHRPKQGFPVPWNEWLNERFAPRIERLLLEPRTADRGWIDPSAVRRLFETHRSGRVNMSRQIWTLWGLELWARGFLDGEPPPGSRQSATSTAVLHAS